MTDLPSVSVIIPVKDDVDGLNSCLDALARTDYEGQMEVIVADNGSSVDLAPAVEGRSGVHFISHPEGGSYAARNAAIAVAMGDVFAFTDSDCIPAPDWVPRAVETLVERPEISAVAGRVQVFVRDPKRPSLVEIYELIKAFPQEYYVRERGFGVTANLVVRADVARAVGGFDAERMSGGDFDFGQRLRSGGHDLVYCPDAVVDHPARVTLEDHYRKRIRVMSGVLRARRRAGEPVRLDWTELYRYLVPPRYAFRLARSDQRLHGHGVRFIVAAWVIRYLDLVAWIRATRAVAREHRT